MLIPNKISTIIAISSVSLALQAQTIIDPLNGTGSVSYTTTAVLDNSSGAGEGVSFVQGSSGLQANYAGTGTSAEQSLYLAPVSSYSSSFAVGDTLYVSLAMPGSTTTAEDFGLAIASASPVAASSANGYNSRTDFDWLSLSVRPSQNAIRVNMSNAGTLTSGNGVVGIGSGGAGNISELYIEWISTDAFTLGYVLNGVATTDETVTFSAGSTIGAEIGFYGDVRATGTSLGTFSNLGVEPTPEPSIYVLAGLGLTGLVIFGRRKISRTV